MKPMDMEANCITYTEMGDKLRSKFKIVIRERSRIISSQNWKKNISTQLNYWTKVKVYHKDSLMEGTTKGK